MAFNIGFYAYGIIGHTQTDQHHLFLAFSNYAFRVEILHSCVHFKIYGLDKLVPGRCRKKFYLMVNLYLQ